MKILFLIPPSLDKNPPAERIFGCNYGIYPQANIFILYPATILKNKGYNVMCMDFPISKKNKRDFARFCCKNDFDIIVFYTVFLSKKTDLLARKMLNEKNRKTKFIFISTEPTASPDEFVDENTVVIRGEPESRIEQVIDALEKGKSFQNITGISYLKNGEIIHRGGGTIIEELDELPFPDRGLFNDSGYNNPKLSLHPFTTIVTSRGCSFNCYYCVPNSVDFAREIEFKRSNGMAKPPVRLRSIQNIIKEFAMLAEEGYRSVAIIDDQFVWGEKRTIDICRGIANYNITWSCLARADMLQNDTVTQAMAQAGCKCVDLGIESFNQEILDYIGKGCKVETFYSAVHNLKKVGIEVKLNILLGSCPLETKEIIENTFRETIKLDPDYVLFSICTPFPYTKFNAVAKNEGWMIMPEYQAIDPMKKSFISYPHLTNKDLENILKRLYRRYYLRPSYLLKRLKRIKGYSDLFNKIKTAVNFFTR